MTGEVTFVALCLHLLLIVSSNQAASAKDSEGGHWSEWGSPSPCSVTCGSGTSQIERVWIPGPNDPPSKEPFTSTQVFSCTSEQFPSCPQDGYWTGWGAWSACTKACGGGERERHRECQGIRYGGKMCEGEKYDKEVCKRDPCPALPRNFDMSQCKQDSNFTCTSKKMCIPLSLKCDATVQCHDGSDELNCPKKSFGWSGVRYDLSRNAAWSPMTEIFVLFGSVLPVILMLVLH